MPLKNWAHVLYSATPCWECLSPESSLDPEFLQPAVQVKPERTRLITGHHVTGELLLSSHKEHELLIGHVLNGQTGRQKFSFKTDKLLLAPGHYTNNVAVCHVIGSDSSLFAWWRSAAAFEGTGLPASTTYVQSFLASNVTV